MKTLTKNKTVRINETVKNGVKLLASGYLENLMFQFDSLSDAGWIKVTSIGLENVYFVFTDDAGVEHKGYCKCL